MNLSMKNWHSRILVKSLLKQLAFYNGPVPENIVEVQHFRWSPLSEFKICIKIIFDKQ